MRIDFNNQHGKPAGRFHVHRLTKNGNPGSWVAWYVDSTEAARSMVAWWRKREPREYPLEQTWVVLVDGDEVDRFRTADAVSGRPDKPNGNGLRMTRWNELRKTWVSVYDGNLAGLDTSGGRWQVVCEKHSTIVVLDKLATARDDAKHDPAEFCEECRS